MVLSPEEVTLLHGMVQTVTNVTTYGYEVAIKGTVITGIANIVSLLLTIIITYICGSKMIGWARIESERRDDPIVYAVASMGIVAVLMICSIVADVLQTSMISIFAPEYIVVKQILAAAV